MEEFYNNGSETQCFFYEPDWLGMYLALVLVLLVAQAVKEKDKKLILEFGFSYF